MRYGVPYKGSKNSIAKWIVDNLPRADTFVDLFCGGCAVTHAALLSGKYKKFIINDIDGRVPNFFLECCYGKHTIENHKEWISREDFFRLKDDIYIALTWSFGNNGIDYIYGKDIEPYKKALHYACFYNDVSLFKDLGIDVPVFNETDIYTRYLLYKKHFFNGYGRLEATERLQSYERLENLYRLQSLQSLQLDYVSVSIPSQALIYCDIPYSSTNCGKYQGFNHDRFYKWAREQDNIYISEYDMPDDFICIAKTEKTVLSAANSNSIKAEEKLFTNKRTYEKLSAEEKEKIKLNFAEQMSIFDLIGGD